MDASRWRVSGRKRVNYHFRTRSHTFSSFRSEIPMLVTFRVAQHEADPVTVVPLTDDAATPTAKDVLKRVCHREQWNEIGEILQSSVTQDTLASSAMAPAKNGFVSTVIEAYGKHHHLKIRYVSFITMAFVHNPRCPAALP